MDAVWGDNVAQNVAFYIIALTMIAAALKMVTTKNVVHAALYLVAVLIGVSGQFILLGAEFIAATQILVYVGAIVVLFLFGIMLTRAQLGRDPEVNNSAGQRGAGAFIAVILLAVMTFAIYQDPSEGGFRDVELAEERVQTVAQVSDSIFSTYLVPFEAISVLLLAALIGAVVLARRD